MKNKMMYDKGKEVRADSQESPVIDYGELRFPLSGQYIANRISASITAEEVRLIEVMRKHSVGFGKVMCIIYYQEGKLNRVEVEKVIESDKL